MSKPKFTGVIRSFRLTQKNNGVLKYVDHRRVSSEDIANYEHTAKVDHEVHKDLKKALNVLRGHAAILAELFPRGKRVDAQYIRTHQCEQDPDLINYDCRGITYKSDDDEKSVTLHMRYNISEGGHYDFDVPAVKIYNNSGYEFSGNLADDLSDVEIEIAKYMDGKFEDNGQMTLFVDEEGELAESEEEL